MYLSEDRMKSLETIRKHTDYSDFNIYSMEILYDYDLEKIMPRDIRDTQKLMDLVFEEALPGVEVSYTAPDYGCSAFVLKGNDGCYRMGRNYDFKFDSSAMQVYCNPKDGYKSVAHAATDNIHISDPLDSEVSKAACLTAPFICIDGINEKGVGIAVLTLDSEPVCHNTGRPVLSTTILIRLVLDKAATAEEAIKLIQEYDMYAIAGRDYHFYITDASGDGRVIEFDCDTPDRKPVVTSTRTVTNFYIMHKDKVLPNQKNGSYGHGRERYDSMEEIFERNKGTGDTDVAWQALKAASQLPNPDNVTSNTQWSIVYNLSDLTLEFILHRHWGDVKKFRLK